MELDELGDDDSGSTSELARLLEGDSVALERHDSATALAARQCHWLLHEEVCCDTHVSVRALAHCLCSQADQDALLTAVRGLGPLALAAADDVRARLGRFASFGGNSDRTRGVCRSFDTSSAASQSERHEAEQLLQLLEGEVRL